MCWDWNRSSRGSSQVRVVGLKNCTGFRRGSVAANISPSSISATNHLPPVSNLRFSRIYQSHWKAIRTSNKKLQSTTKLSTKQPIYIKIKHNFDMIIKNLASFRSDHLYICSIPRFDSIDRSIEIFFPFVDLGGRWRGTGLFGAGRSPERSRLMPCIILFVFVPRGACETDDLCQSRLGNNVDVSFSILLCLLNKTFSH